MRKSRKGGKEEGRDGRLIGRKEGWKEAEEGRKQKRKRQSE